jgi:uncharacterized protein (TIGR03083 family)
VPLSAVPDRGRQVLAPPPEQAGQTLIATDLLLAEVTGSAGTLAGIAATADLTAQVPTCPDWTLRQLITHVGRAHRWAAAIVATQAAQPIPFREVPGGRLPDNPAERPAWLRDGAARLAEAVATGSGPVWTHQGPGPASYWARRMAHETAVHRADGQIAVGTRPEIDPVIAADGIAEWLGLLPAGPAGAGPERPAPVPDGKAVHFHVTDEGVDGEWLVRGGPGGVTVAAGHARGDAALRGPASAILLVMLRRLPPDDPAVEILGDRSLLDGWLAATPF